MTGPYIKVHPPFLRKHALILAKGMFGEVIFPPLASIEIIWPIIWVVGIIAIQIYKKGK